MLHKIIFHGRNTNPFDYLIRQERAVPARVILGDEAMVQESINTCPHSRKYTSLVLSFEEEVCEKTKLEIISSYEEIAYAGIDDSDIMRIWIEHRDKARTELHCVVSNHHRTGNRWQHYLHSKDKALFKNWQELTNLIYGFSSVDDPERERLESIPSNKLPHNRKAEYAEIDSKVCKALLSRTENTRDDIIELLRRDCFEVRPHRTDIGVRPVGSSEKFLRLKGRKYKPGFNYKDFLEGFKERKEWFLDIKERQEKLIKQLDKNLTYRKRQNSKIFKQDNINIGLINYENTEGNRESLRRSPEGFDRTTEEGYRPIEISKTALRSGARGESDQSGVDRREHEVPERRYGFDYFNLVRIRIGQIKRRLHSDRRLGNKKTLGHSMRILRLQRMRLRKMLTHIYYRFGPDRGRDKLRGPNLK
jgi:hypothetical protein